MSAHLRLQWRVARGVVEPQEVYRGVPVEMTPEQARPLLQALTRGSLRAAADVLIGYMAEGAGTDRWTGQPYRGTGGAGGWWIDSYLDASRYAGWCGVVVMNQEGRGNLVCPVVMTAMVSEEANTGWEGVWKLDPGTPLTIHRFEVEAPTARNSAELLRILDTQGAWSDPHGMFDPLTWEEGEVTETQTLVLPIPPMQTAASFTSIPRAVDSHWRPGGFREGRAVMAASVQVGQGSPLPYDRFNVTHRLSLIEGSGWHPDADIESARQRMEEGYQKWRSGHPRVKRPDRYTDPTHWVKPGFTYFTSENTEPGTIAFVDLEVYGGSQAVFVAFLSVRPDKRGQGHARRLMQEVYDRWPEAKVHWGKLMADEMGHLYEDFKARYPDRTPHAPRNY